jgi:mannose-6-phosphate isomerase-like protein (cupin superfamily)
MPDYTMINFGEVEDSASGRGYDVQARFARKHIDSEHLGVTQFRFGPSSRAPFGHRHREQEEVYVVVSGSGRAKLDDEMLDIRVGDVLRVAPQVARGFESGPEGLELIAIGNDRPEGGDGEMVEDFWGEQS